MKKFLSALMAGTMALSMAAMPVQAAQQSTTLNISSSDESVAISDKLYGSFIEDISFACDGGLVSNLVNNDSFEYEFNKTTAWKAEDITLEAATEKPLNENNPTYAQITVNGSGTLTNTGYTELYDYKSYDLDKDKAATPDMGFVKDTSYDFSCYINNVNFKGKVSVYLDSPKNKSNVTELDISNCSGGWRQVTAVLTAAADEDGGLTIVFDGTGTLELDFVTLVPHSSYGYGTDSWKYTTLRSDLFEALKNLNPGFIRFPGGCLAEGDSLEHLYDWKETIGPLEERVQFYNLWRDDAGRDYINTNAMGYHEYFQLCSDLGAEPLPILNVGLTCQGRASYDDYAAAHEKLTMSDSQWEEFLTNSRNFDPDDEKGREEYTEKIEALNIKSDEDWEAYLDTIALRPGTDEWDNYVQDILDLIEYANGDATTSYWGALRAANGSQEPFNLKYIGLGNENWGEIYERNFKALYKAVKEKYPDITIISSSGTWLEGEAYDENWAWINQDYKDTIVDEHYYTNDGYLFDHNDRYDNFDRNGAHVFVGEYAATSKGVGTIQTKSNMIEAVEEASFLTGLERNGDVVEMASYAPTFAKVNAQCWNVNLIWFDSRETVLTPSYYVQMLFANNYGTKYIKSVFDNSTTIQNGVYESVTVDEENEVLYVKLVNTDGKKKSVNLKLDGYSPNAVSVQQLKGDYKSACNEIGKNTTAPTEYSIDPSEAFDVELGKYDVSVVRIAYGSNKGDNLYELPEKAASTVSEAGDKYVPPAIKIGIPCGIAGVVVIAAAAAGIAAVVKKKRKRS